MTAKTKTPAGLGARHDRTVQEYQHDTSTLPRVALVVLSLILLVTFSVGIMTVEATIVVPPTDSVIEVDTATRKAVIGVFEQAEDAIKARDLDKVMDIYSLQYNYHGLQKEDIRKISKELFDEYQAIASTHLFAKMTKIGGCSELEVTCTGHLWAKSKTSGLYVPIDSWYEEVHDLLLEDGDWRIRDNLRESARVLPFGTTPHPLF
ncbi:MAG TPA: hypothetical protein PKD12_09530 [Nitrospira sp.]|nr:hypothetical protein [Nitrospira sp.]